MPGSRPPPRRPPEERYRTVVVGADPGSLDPHLSVFVSTNAVNSYAYETLVYLSADGEITPGLAESWEESPTSVTYTLKDGVTCADGTTLTATAVADNFSFVADPANQSPLLGLYVPPGITVEADDAARTVTLTSETPVPFMLQNTGAAPSSCARQDSPTAASSPPGPMARVRTCSRKPSPTTTTT